MIRFRRSFNDSEQNIIKYIGTAKVEPSQEGFGANYLSNKSTWNSSTGEGVMVFDGPINAIPSTTFKGKVYLTSITYLPNSVKHIESGAFRMDSYTSSLESINLNEGLLTIGNRAFLSNRKLTSITCPNSLEHIHAFAFNTCPYIHEVTIGENFKSFIDKNGVDNNDAGGVFGVVYYLYKVNWNAINCRDFANTETCPFSSVSMFSDGNYVNPIKTLTFGDNVEHIPAYLAFATHSLTGCIDIPASCKSIGDRCFQDCFKLKTVICRAIEPPLITPGTYDSFTAKDGKNVIFRCWKDSKIQVLPITIYVPAQSLEAYRTDPNWQVYFDVLQPMLEYGEVDLGLRTADGKKILFADRNVGATGPFAIGKYFAWGETTGASVNVAAGETESAAIGQVFSKSTYEHSDSTYTTLNKYNATDNYLSLEAGDDAATVHMGNKWRTISAEEMSMLLDESKFTMEVLDTNGQVLASPTRYDQKVGIRFVSKIPGFEGNSVIFPAAGAGVDDHAKDIHLTVSLWTNSRVSSNVKKAHFLYFYITETDAISLKVSTTDRYYGRQVRGVKIV